MAVWKVSKYGVISGTYFPVFGLNTGKYGPEITPYLDTFHAVGRGGDSKCSGLPIFIFLLKKIENWICVMTKHHISVDSDV